MATIRDPRDSRQDDENYGNKGSYHDHPRQEHPREDEDNCNDGSNPTDISIRNERNKVCEELKGKAAVVQQWEQIRHGAHQLYNDKKCCFVKTEMNYQFYRNLELSVGIELVQVNEGIKENVGAYKTLNDDLAKTLKEIVNATKEAKIKVAELKEAACKLNTCINDGCNSTQKKLLTGESYDNCKNNDQEMEDKCNSREVLHHLEHGPTIFLQDMNIIFNSAARVSGIQMFSNVTSLDPLQKLLQEKSKAFDDFIVEKMKKGSDDLKKVQDELGKAIQELTKSTTGLYSRRSDYKGVLRATKKLCDCHCECIRSSGYEGRLEQCKCDICDICDEVKTGVCRPEDNPVCRPKQHQEQTHIQTY